MGSMLRNVRIVETDEPDVGHTSRPTMSNQPADFTPSLIARIDGANMLGTSTDWHSIVTSVSSEARKELEQLISQQAWAVPDRSMVYRYTFSRAVETEVSAARSCFHLLSARDAASEGTAKHQLQRQFAPPSRRQLAFFCGDPQQLADVISSPFGFAQVFEGAVLLFALDLRHAEALIETLDMQSCDHGASSSPLVNRTVVAELALGRCCTATMPLQDAVHMGTTNRRRSGCAPFGSVFKAAYSNGADSLYFPQSGIVALLNPMRALPRFLSEYHRERLHISHNEASATARSSKQKRRQM